MSFSTHSTNHEGWVSKCQHHIRYSLKGIICWNSDHRNVSFNWSLIKNQLICISVAIKACILTDLSGDVLGGVSLSYQQAHHWHIFALLWIRGRKAVHSQWMPSLFCSCLELASKGNLKTWKIRLSINEWRGEAWGINVDKSLQKGKKKKETLHFKAEKMERFCFERWVLKIQGYIWLLEVMQNHLVVSQIGFLQTNPFMCLWCLSAFKQRDLENTS